MGADLELQNAHTAEIEEAVKEARQLMRFGSTAGALEQLVGIKEWCCANSDLGSEALLELGMTYIAAGEADTAKPILTQLQARAPSTTVKRAAQQLLFQEEAQSFMKADASPLASANDEFAKIARSGLERSLGVGASKRYDIAAAYLTSGNRPPVSSISEARQVLRSSAVRRDDGGAPQRIEQALDYLRTLQSKERLPKARNVDDLIGGEWLLGFTTSGKSISFAPPEAAMQIGKAVVTAAVEKGRQLDDGGGAARSRPYERLTPGPVGLIQTKGSLALSIDEPGGGGGAAVVAGGGGKPRQAESVSLRLGVEERRLGPFPLPGAKEEDESVLLLDTLMCVTRPLSIAGVDYCVYVRPTMARSQAALDDD